MMTGPFFGVSSPWQSCSLAVALVAVLFAVDGLDLALAKGHVALAHHVGLLSAVLESTLAGILLMLSPRWSVELVLDLLHFLGFRLLGIRRRRFPRFFLQ